MVKFNPLVRADRQIAILLFAFVFAGYLRMIAPDVLSGDAGEFHFAAWNWGLAHPTGYPLYLLVGGAWQHLLGLLGISPAWALNALNALIGAVAVCLTYLVVRRWLGGPLLISRIAALFSALYLAANPTFWSQSLIAEVYPLHVVFLLLVMWVAQGLEILSADGENVEVSPYQYRNHILLLFFLVGLSLTHHAMTLLFIPGLLVYIWLVYRSFWRSPGLIVGSLLVAALPLLLYLYIPLRSGPEASPWYHQRLGDTTLMLYANDWQSFLDYVTGRSISIGFNGLAEALGGLPQALLLWRLNFNWAGLVLIVVGLAILVWRRSWPVLAVTGLYALFQGLFNFFYGIGDILVYYIPLYLMAVIWIGFAAQSIGLGFQFDTEEADPEEVEPGEVKDNDVGGASGVGIHQDAGEATEAVQGVVGREVDNEVGQDASSLSQAPAPHISIGLIFLLFLFLLPLRQFRTYSQQLDQSESNGARQRWEAILAAEPPADALLVSNDRNDIVPLFYLQSVEKRGQGMTGLFPLITPGTRFEDIGATLDTALADGGEQPVFLIKEMPGLETKFVLQSQNPPLVEVIGPAISGLPTHAVEQSLGPLHLTGYDWHEGMDGEDNTVGVDLHWRVEEPVDGDYTTTVQLFDAAGEKIGQDDRAAGGLYYPTSFWKTGEMLLDSHPIQIAEGAIPSTILVGMYTGPEFEPLAAPLEISLSSLGD